MISSRSSPSVRFRTPPRPALAFRSCHSRLAVGRTTFRAAFLEARWEHRDARGRSRSSRCSSRWAGPGVWRRGADKECGGAGQPCCAEASCNPDLACGGDDQCAVPPAFTIGGTVGGLTSPGLVLRNNGGDPLAIQVAGTFTFPTPLKTGSAYSVTVSQPAARTDLYRLRRIGNGGNGERHRCSRGVLEPASSCLRRRGLGGRARRLRPGAPEQRRRQSPDRRRRPVHLPHGAHPWRPLPRRRPAAADGTDVHRRERLGGHRGRRGDGRRRLLHVELRASLHHRGDGERARRDGARAP